MEDLKMFSEEYRRGCTYLEEASSVEKQIELLKQKQRKLYELGINITQKEIRSKTNRLKEEKLLCEKSISYIEKLINKIREDYCLNNGHTYKVIGVNKNTLDLSERTSHYIVTRMCEICGCSYKNEERILDLESIIEEDAKKINRSALLKKVDNYKITYNDKTYYLSSLIKSYEYYEKRLENINILLENMCKYFGHIDERSTLYTDRYTNEKFYYCTRCGKIEYLKSDSNKKISYPKNLDGESVLSLDKVLALI